MWFLSLLYIRSLSIFSLIVLYCGYLFYFSFLIFLSGFSCGTKFSICYTVFALALSQPLCLSHVSWGPLHVLSPLSWLPTLLFTVTHLTSLFPGFPLKHHLFSDNLLDLPSSLLNYCCVIVSSLHAIRAWSAWGWVTLVVHILATVRCP